MSTSMDFHLVSEDADFKVYQAMERKKTKEVDGFAPTKYSPLLPKNVTDVDVTDYFSGYDVDSVKVSKTGGIVVRIKRDKSDPYVEVEPDVTRLELKGGK